MKLVTQCLLERPSTNGVFQTMRWVNSDFAIAGNKAPALGKVWTVKQRYTTHPVDRSKERFGNILRIENG